MPADSKARDLGRRLRTAAILLVLRAPLLLPYGLRITVTAWLMAYVFGPIAGYRSRIRQNLAYVCPELDEREVRRLCRAVPANTGRMLIESSSGTAFTDRLEGLEISGPGVPALDAAREAGEPIVAISGHFGNFDVVRHLLVKRGHKLGGLYRPIDDPTLDKYFHDVLTGISEPVFPRSRRGLAQMVRFLRAGNMIAMLLDQYVNRGAPLTFFGKQAPTSLSAAEMALKYNAILLPMYGIRRGDSFEVIAEAPIEHSDAMTMTQAINDSLEARVRADMDQWLWIHRRWKPERQARHRKREDARTAP